MAHTVMEWLLLEACLLEAVQTSLEDVDPAAFCNLGLNDKVL